MKALRIATLRFKDLSFFTFLDIFGSQLFAYSLRQQRPMPVNGSNLRLKGIFWGNEEIVPFCLFTKVDANKTYLEASDVLAVIQLFFPHALKISKSASTCMYSF